MFQSEAISKEKYPGQFLVYENKAIYLKKKVLILGGATEWYSMNESTIHRPWDTDTLSHKLSHDKQTPWEAKHLTT